MTKTTAIYSKEEALETLAAAEQAIAKMRQAAEKGENIKLILCTAIDGCLTMRYTIYAEKVDVMNFIDAMFRTYPDIKQTLLSHYNTETEQPTEDDA